MRTTQTSPNLRHSAKDLRYLADGFNGLLPGVFYSKPLIDMRACLINHVPSFRDLDDFARAVAEGSVFSQRDIDKAT